LSVSDIPTVRQSSHRLLLYGTLGCHLCDQAAAVLATWMAPPALAIEQVDIADHESLFERYGIRIPVLADPAMGWELDWPFTLDDVREALTRNAPEG